MDEDTNFKDLSFEEKIKMMEQMPEKEIKKGIEQIKFICKDFCGKCPSYLSSHETKLAFCSIGKSTKIREKKGCLCDTCPVTKMMGLRWHYYCVKGSALELSKND